MRIYYSILYLVAVIVVPPVGSQKPSATPKPIEATVCEIVENPADFNNKLVKVRGYVSVNFEYSLLLDEGCSHDPIWFAYEDGTGTPSLKAGVNGNGRPGREESSGAAIPTLSVKLVRDPNFEKFERYMKIKAEAKPCYNDPSEPTPIDCDVVRVNATFTGRIDSVSKEVHAAHLKRTPHERPDFKGFGQMGMFEAQLVVALIEDVQAIDYFGRAKP